MRHYLKEIHSNGIMDRNGKYIQFDLLGGDYGGLEIDETKPENAQLIEDLEKFCNDRVGGVMRSSAEELKKNASLPRWQLSASPSEPLQVAPSTTDRPRVGGVAADKPAPAPVVVQQEQAPVQPSPLVPVAPNGFKPRRGRASVVQPVLVKPMLPAESV